MYCPNVVLGTHEILVLWLAHSLLVCWRICYFILMRMQCFQWKIYHFISTVSNWKNKFFELHSSCCSFVLLRIFLMYLIFFLCRSFYQMRNHNPLQRLLIVAVLILLSLATWWKFRGFIWMCLSVSCTTNLCACQLIQCCLSLLLIVIIPFLCNIPYWL